MPLWNPLSGCGEPWLAQLQTGVFYPGDLVFLLPFAFAPLIAIALHVTIAAAGMTAWLEDLGASRFGALAGALLFAGGASFISLFPIYNNACTAAFLPWIFWGARRAMKGASVTGFALASALALLAGEPALAVAGIAAGAVLAWYTRREGEPVLRERSGSAGLRMSAGIVLALGLTAVTLVPFAELLHRSGRVTGATREEALALPVGTSDLGDLVAPPTLETTRQRLPGRGGYLVSLAGSPLCLVLAAGCLAGFPGRRRFLILLAGFAVTGFLLSLGSHGLLTPLLYDSGLFAGLRFPARWFIFAHLFLSVAVGAGLDGWIWGSFEARGNRAVVFLAAGIGALLFLAAFSGGTGPRDLVRCAVVWLAAALAIVLFVAFRFGIALTARPRLVAALTLLALGAPLGLISRDPLEGVSAARLEALPEISAGLERLPGRTLAASGDARILASFTQREGTGWTPELPLRAHDALAGYTNLLAGVALAGTASPIPNPRTVRLLGAALSGGDAATVLGLADVRHLVTPFPTAMPGAKFQGQHRKLLRYDLASGKGRIFFAERAVVSGDEEVFAAIRLPGFDPEAIAYTATSPGALTFAPRRRSFSTARIVRDTPELLELSTSCSDPRFAVVTRTFDPGWHATVDGKEASLVRTDLAFIGILIPAGAHEVLLQYRPASYRIGVLVSLVSVIVFVGLAAAGRPPEENT